MGKVVLRWRPGPWEKVPLMCRIFGHKWVDGWFGDRPYFRQAFNAIDNLNTFHIRLSCECDRCGAQGDVGYIHHRSKSEILGRPYPE